MRPLTVEAVDIVFQSFNRYLGVAVGEHLGYTLTGTWSILTGVALIETDAVPGWLGVIGGFIGPLFLFSSLEFLGRFEPSGWKLAGQLTPVAYILWSLWLVATGVAWLAAEGSTDADRPLPLCANAGRVGSGRNLRVWILKTTRP